MRQILLLFIVLLTICSCNNEAKRKAEIREYEIQDSLEKDSISKSLFKKADKEFIRKGNKVIGEFYLGMSKKEFISAKEHFEKTIGSFELCSINFRIASEGDSSIINDIWFGGSGPIIHLNDDGSTYDVDAAFFNHFENKYGNPTYVLDENYQECAYSEMKYMVWCFSKRTLIFMRIPNYFDKRKDCEYIIRYCLPEVWKKEMKEAEELNKWREEMQKDREKTNEKVINEL
jgi:hypothetical protein